MNQNQNNNNSRSSNPPNNSGVTGNNNTGGTNYQKKDFNQKKDSNVRHSYHKSNRNDYHKKQQNRYNTESFATKIANPKREETVEDIKMDIDKLEKDIQFEIKQIRSVKLGL